MGSVSHILHAHKLQTEFNLVHCCCSKACQTEDWKYHKVLCKSLVNQQKVESKLSLLEDRGKLGYKHFFRFTLQVRSAS